MKKTTSWYPMLGVGTIVLAGLAGCQDKNNNGQPDSPATTEQIDKSVENAGNAASDAAGKAGDAVTGAADKAGDAAGDLATTGRVKSAIIGNDTIDSTKINVNTANNVVSLKGTVKNAAQSKLAQSIAAKTATGYAIKNELKVSGGASPMMKKSGSGGY